MFSGLFYVTGKTFLEILNLSSVPLQFPPVTSIKHCSLCQHDVNTTGNVAVSIVLKSH